MVPSSDSMPTFRGFFKSHGIDPDDSDRAFECFERKDAIESHEGVESSFGDMGKAEEGV
jgi:DNA-binding transcriptional regulator YhcF (GntR family)